MRLQSCQGPEELGHWEFRLHPKGHEDSCSAAGGIFLNQGSNPCPLNWQVDSYSGPPKKSRRQHLKGRWQDSAEEEVRLEAAARLKAPGSKWQLQRGGGVLGEGRPLAWAPRRSEVPFTVEGGGHGGTGFGKALSVRTFRGTSGEMSGGLYIYLELKVRLEIQAQKTAAVGMKPWRRFLKTSA